MDEFLHGTLLLKAFDWAEQEILRTTGVKPSITHVSRWLSDYIDREQQFPFGDKSLRDYRNKAIASRPVTIKQPEVLAALAKLLGYRDFADFYGDHRKDPEVLHPKEVPKFRGYERRRRRIIRIVITISFLVVMGIWAAVYLSHKGGILKGKEPTQQVMVWKEDRYVMVPEEKGIDKEGYVVPYDEDVLQNFKKKPPDSIDFFFAPNGDALIWYGKNKKGEYEYFTRFGKHPETGKYLRPITYYMINKYILPQRIKDTLVQ